MLKAAGRLRRVSSRRFLGDYLKLGNMLGTSPRLVLSHTQGRPTKTAPNVTASEAKLYHLTEDEAQLIANNESLLGGGDPLLACTTPPHKPQRVRTAPT